jgi:MYXO-CTERM domain-containing protein
MRKQVIGITLALVGLAAPVAHAASTLTYGPIISRGTTGDKMIVHWGTDDVAGNNSVDVQYRVKGSATVLTATATRVCKADSAKKCDYEATLPALAVGTEYEYAVGGNALGATQHFGTCPAVGQSLDVVFYGDSRSGGSIHQAVAAKVLAGGADIVFESGDIQLDGIYDNYLSTTDTGNQPGFFVGAKSLVSVIPFMAVPGNHEKGQIGTTDMKLNYALLFPNPSYTVGDANWLGYYSFTCGGVMFIGLDGNSPGTTQNNWLKAQLATAAGDANIKHVFAWMHQSPYSSAVNHGGETATRVWVPDFEAAANKVRGVFSGHDHNYQRMTHGGITYIVSGGAGAGLYDLSANPSNLQGVTIEKTAKQYNFVKLHITPDFVSGTAFDGQTGAPIEMFTLFGTPGDMAGGGGSGGSGGGGSGGTGGGGGGGGGDTGGGGSGGSGGGTGTGGNGNNGGMGGCSVAGTASYGTSAMLLLAAAFLVLRRRRAS